ncbi:MAG: YtxH domain-containing protein [Armatimonadota bacterium]
MANDEERNVLLSVLAGIGLGAIVGAAAGLLFAPKPGEETRESIMRAADQLKKRAEGVVSEFGTSAEDLVQKSRELVESTRTRVQQAVESGRQAMSEKKEELEKEMTES